jgi:hypothetical protein
VPAHCRRRSIQLLLASLFLIHGGVAQTFTDAFGASTVLTNFILYRVSGDNTTATVETNEPAHANAPAQRSLWTRVRTPYDAHCQFTFENSVSPGMRLAVYTGSSIDALTSVATFMSDTTNRTSGVVLSSNTVYHIAVDSRSTNGGAVRLAADLRQAYLRSPRDGDVIPGPAAITLEGVWTDTSRPLRQMDFYGGETVLTRVGSRTNTPWSIPLTNALGYPRFYIIATPKSGSPVTSQTITVRVAPPNDRFDDAIVIPPNTMESLFTGSTKGSAAEAAEPRHLPTSAPAHSIWWRWTPIYGTRVTLKVTNAVIQPSTIAVYTGSTVTNLKQMVYSSTSQAAAFNAAAGTTYSICLETGPTSEGAVSWILSQPTLYIYPTDADSTVRAGETTGFTVVNLAPDHPLERVEWFANGVSIGTRTSAPFDLSFAPTTQGSLTVTARGIDELGNIRFSSANGLTVRPSNDAFQDAMVLSADASQFQVTANSRASTLEPGEPAHAGGPNAGSLWYVWTPTAPGVARFTLPLELNGAVRLAAYTGGTITNLTRIAANQLPTADLTNHLVFSAQAGVTYRIVVDGATAMPPFTLEFERHTLVFSRPTLGSDLDFGRTNRFELASLDPAFEPTGGVWLMDGTEVGSITGAPAVWDWRGDAGGLHTFSARATNAAGETRITAPFFAYVGPANDDFNRAEIITASDGPWAVEGDSAFATWEQGEIETSGWPDTGSVWFRWVPPRSRQYTMHFTGPEGTEMDGFMGENVAAAMPLFRGGSVDSWPTAYISGGTTNYFRVFRRWQAGGAGPFRIELFASPANDDFTNAIAIPSGGGTFTAVNRSASFEPGEPYFGCMGTLWWQWTAPSAGEVIVTAADSDCNAIGAVFRGDAVDALTMIGQPGTLVSISSTTGAKNTNPLITRVKAGVTYHIALGTGSGVEGPTSGTIRGSLSFRAILNLPPNDDFADRTRITAAEVTATGNTSNATREPGESDENGQRTLWWEWTAPQDGAARFWLESSLVAPVLMLYQEAAGGSLMEAYPRLDRLNFSGISGPFTRPVTAGERFHISAGEAAWSTTPGPVTLRVQSYPLPTPSTNDAIRNATLVTASEFTTSLDLFGATYQPGEPSAVAGLPPIATYSGSLWWRFVPPANGRVTLALPNPSGVQPPIIGLYRGTAFDNLQLINHAFGGPIIGEVQGGEEYRISVTGPSLAAGPWTLQLKMQDLVPTHNAFAGSVHLEGTNITVSDLILGCNREPGEPSHGLNPTETLSGISAWWSWAAPFTGKAVLTFPGAADRFRLAVYAGPTLDRLAPVSAARELERTFFAAQKDVVYHIAIELLPGADGLVGFRIDESPFATTSPNDAFADAIELRGRSAGSLASNLAATREPREPAHRPGGPNKSLWWRWIQPNSGDTQISNWEGALRDVTFAVYTGTAVDALTLVAKGEGYLRFAGTAGQSYYIAAETRADDNGDIDLQVSCPWPDGSSEPVQGNAVRNGSFEEVVDALPIAHWDAPTGFLGAVGMIGAEGSADGTNYLVLSGNIIRQDIPTLPGGAYRLRLAICATDQDGPARVDVRFGAQRLPVIAFEADYTQRYWHWIEFNVEASDAATMLEVESTGVRVGVDAVSVALRNQPPHLITPPESRMAYLGTGASFHAGVAGDPPLVYRWEHDGTVMPDAVTSTLYLPSVAPSHAGSYQLIVNNAFGSVTSAPVHLRVEAPASPTIVLQPQGQAVAIGEFVAIAVSAIGTPPLRYQWFRKGQPMDGATNRNLSFASYRDSDAGDYSVVVSNLAEAVNSLPATLRTAVTPTGGGLVRFANWVPDPQFPIKAWVTDVDGVTRLAGDAFRAQLYAGPDSDTLRPAGQPQPFLAGFGAGVWTPDTVALPMIPPGASCVVQVRVWEASMGASYEEARAMGGRIGRSTPLAIAAGGEGAADPMPALLAGLRGFALTAGQPQFRVGELSVTGRDADGTIRFRLLGQPGSRYLIEKRSGAGIWSPFRILDVSAGTAEFTDSAAVPQDAAAFYRARMLD